MTQLENIFYFIVALGILVTIHEYGHFWVARKLGVKVLTFSIGFGKAIWQRTSKDGVNYKIAMIPLGGYVKMLDEREGDVAEEDKPYAFNQKSVWTRMAIVLAGPIANFILAIGLYWWMFVLGITGLSTEMGQIDEDSIAGKAGLVAGDMITKVDGQPVVLLQDATLEIVKRIGENTTLDLEVQSSSGDRIVSLNLSSWVLEDSKPKILSSLGIRHAREDQTIEPIIAFVSENSPAFLSGLQPGDHIKQFNQKPVDSWNTLTEKMIEPNPGKTVLLLVERNGELREISVVLASRELEGKQSGFLGIGPLVPNQSNYFKIREGEFLESFGLAINETQKMISLTVQLFGKLLTGDLSHKSLSGPFSIAEGAGGSARLGLVYFIAFIAMISVNLGFINLLPIPVLDGGHFLYFSIEALRGKPLSEKTQELGLQIGMLMVFSLMAVAIFNDFTR